MRFIALKDFWSEETQSQYVEGLSYTATTSELEELVKGWIAEGKIVLGGPPEVEVRGVS